VDLVELFRQQREDERATMIYFVLKDGDHECLQRHAHEKTDDIVGMLKTCKYIDTKMGIPYFEKKVKKNAAKTA
jgi:hypothetical protein